MSEVSRREAFLALAAGAAGATAVGNAALGAPADPASVPSMRALAGAREAARRFGCAPEERPGMMFCEAMVLLCRSWDGQVYLYASDGVKGFVPAGPSALAIASACQAAGRPVVAACWGYDARWGGGVGRFEGAVLAIDAADLPGETSLG